MSIEDEIFEEFFQKLENDEKFPNKVLNNLKELKNDNKVISKDLILNAIKEGVIDENKEH